MLLQQFSVVYVCWSYDNIRVDRRYTMAVNHATRDP